MTRSAALVEQAPRDLRDRLVRRALAHPDQHDPATDRHHVAALERGQATVPGLDLGVAVAQPDREVHAGELRVELVHRGGQQGFLAAGRPVHRVERDAAVDPRAVVPHEQGVRQRVDDEAGRVLVLERRQEAAADLVGHVLEGDAADQVLGQLRGRHLVEPGADVGGEAETDQVTGDLAVEQPGARFRDPHDVGDAVLELQHLDTALLELGDEVEVVALGLLDPDDVVEEQPVGGAGREPLVGQARRRDQHLSELACLGPDAGGGSGVHERSPFRWWGCQTESQPALRPTRAITEVSATTAAAPSSGVVKTGSLASLRAQTYAAVPTR